MNFGYDLLKSVPTEHKSKLTPMLSQFLSYINDLKTTYGKVIPAKYTETFFQVYSDLELSEKKELYKDRKTHNGNRWGI